MTDLEKLAREIYDMMQAGGVQPVQQKACILAALQRAVAELQSAFDDRVRIIELQLEVAAAKELLAQMQDHLGTKSDMFRKIDAFLNSAD